MTERTSRTLVWAGIIAYTLYFFAVCWQKFHNFLYFDFDLSVHDLAMWNMVHGSLFNSILDIPYLGNHMHLVMFLCAPVYALFPSPLTLLFLQTAALAATALPLYAACRTIIGHRWAMMLALLYLGYPAVGYVNLYEFHPTVFATFFLASACYFFQVRRFALFIASCAVSLLCQENVPLGVMMFGALAFLQKRGWKWVVVPLAGAGVYAAGALGLMAHLNNNTIQFQRIYAHLGTGPGDILRNSFLHPHMLIGTLMRPQVWMYLCDTFLPLSFLPLFSPAFMVPALPFFAQHILSNRGAEQTVYYHYSAELLPFIFMSTAYALRRALLPCSQRSQRVMLAGVVAVVLCASNIFYLGPHLRVAGILLSPTDTLTKIKYRFLSRIPADASVVSTFEFQAHLSHRRRLYSLHHAYTGRHTLSLKPYILPKDVQYALVNFNDLLTFNDFYSRDRVGLLRQTLLDSGWQLEGLADSVALFSKNPGAQGGFLVRPVERVPESTQFLAVIEGAVGLGQAQAQLLAQDGILEVLLPWTSLEETNKDIRMFIDIIDRHGKLLERKIHPFGYHLYPTYSLKKGECLQERLRLVLPAQAVAVEAGFYDAGTGKQCRVQPSKDKEIRIIVWKSEEKAHATGPL